jgi:hypothetical protein
MAEMTGGLGPPYLYSLKTLSEWWNKEEEDENVAYMHVQTGC